MREVSEWLVRPDLTNVIHHWSPLCREYDCQIVAFTSALVRNDHSWHIIVAPSVLFRKPYHLRSTAYGHANRLLDRVCERSCGIVVFPQAASERQYRFFAALGSVLLGVVLFALQVPAPLQRGPFISLRIRPLFERLF